MVKYFACKMNRCLMCQKDFNCFYMCIDQINCFIKLLTSKLYIVVLCSNLGFILLAVKFGEDQSCFSKRSC